MSNTIDAINIKSSWMSSFSNISCKKLLLNTNSASKNKSDKLLIKILGTKSIDCKSMFLQMVALWYISMVYMLYILYIVILNNQILYYTTWIQTFTMVYQSKHH